MQTQAGTSAPSVDNLNSSGFEGVGGEGLSELSSMSNENEQESAENASIEESQDEEAYLSQGNEDDDGLEDLKKTYGKKEGEKSPQEQAQDLIDLGKLEKFVFDGKEYTPETLKAERLMQADYTKKTMAIAEKEKQFEKQIAEVAAKEKEYSQYQEKLDQFSEVNHYLDYLGKVNPELFDQINESMGQFRVQYNNPLVSAMRKELNEIKSTFTKQSVDKTITDVNSQFNKEMKDLEDKVLPELKSLGFENYDKEALKKHWYETGLSMEQVFNALYGSNIRKLAMSKSKVSLVENKIKNSTKIVPTASTRSVPVKKGMPNLNKMNDQQYREYLHEVGMTG